MTTHISFTAPSDWRHAFRQHALDVDPSLGQAGDLCQDVRAEHWILDEALLRSIVVSLAVDTRELGRWDGSNAALDNKALLDLVVQALAVNDERPTTAFAYFRFLVAFLGKAIQQMAMLRRKTARAKNAARRRGGREFRP